MLINSNFPSTTVNSSTSQRSLWSHLEKPLTGLLLTLSLLLTAEGLPSLKAQGAEKPSSLSSKQVSEVAITSSTTQLPSLQDGTYLYGQSPQAEQIGSTYLVFEVHHNQVVGAFYMPYSSFDCFHGELRPNALALTVVDSYELTDHSYAVALQQEATVAETGNGAIAPFALAGYYPIANVSNTDQQILATCRATVQL